MENKKNEKNNANNMNNEKNTNANNKKVEFANELDMDMDNKKAAKDCK